MSTRRSAVAALFAMVVAIPSILVAADAPAPVTPKTDYYAVMINDQKVGHVTSTRLVTGDRVTTTDDFYLEIKRGGMAMVLTTETTAIETTDGKPLGFDTRTVMSGMTTKSHGEIDSDGRLVVTETVGGQTSKRTIDWPKGALLSEGMDLLERKHGLKAGTTFEALSFRPDEFRAVKVVTTVGEKEKIDLLGRVVEATKVTEDAHVAPGTVLTAVNYIDDNFRTLQTRMDLAGMQFTIIKCEKAFAMSKAESTLDFLSDMLLKSPVPIPSGAEAVTYTLTPREAGKKLTLPSLDSQDVTVNSDGTLTVTVRRLAMAEGQALPWKGDNAEVRKALESTRYIQCDDPAIVKIARETVGDTTDAAAAANKLAKWVSDNIRSKNLSVGYASASEVVKSREGDCTEHAVLLAALCRAAGIPARVASGMLYVDSVLGSERVFGGHEWTQVYIGGKWVDIDATLPPAFADPRRIILSVGDAFEDDWYAMLNSLNVFRVTAVKVTR